jgi:hypothetical protein
MNERHEELLAQAWIEFAPGSQAVTKRFAELIVKECVTKLTPYLDDQFIDDIESELKEHFGFKE